MANRQYARTVVEEARPKKESPITRRPQNASFRKPNFLYTSPKVALERKVPMERRLAAKETEVLLAERPSETGTR